ncbi:MAG: hypothetical protein M1831_006398 [Alyxoria varia]|nr:MAG: hypothetical protein M1831_006398 [Alyxoria varia]
MIRLRRYRVFAAIAVFVLLGLFYLGDTQSWRSSFTSPISQHSFGNKQTVPKPPLAKPEGTAQELLSKQKPYDEKNKPPIYPDEEDIKSKNFPQIEIPGVKPKETTSEEIPGKPAPTPTEVEEEEATLASTKTKGEALKGKNSSTSSKKYGKEDSKPHYPSEHDLEDELDKEELGRQEIRPEASETPLVKWSKVPENFPVPSSAFIPLPTNKAKKLPSVQAKFEKKNIVDKKARQKKLDKVKQVLLRQWKGYKDNAWEHDELKPVSGGFADPFAGWRATLVDTLDTLWIMDLKDEFEEAVAEVKKINFQTTRRENLPLFEVAIRYMGGLVAAYDISGRKYSVLIEKAKDLGEVLMGAFDTPNRMPTTHYTWIPDVASRPRAAPDAAVLAELGSLSVEFTRLAQLTQEDKYYDAVARITNELDAYQNKTALPGLWPLMIDETGGCTSTNAREMQAAHGASKGPTPPKHTADDEEEDEDDESVKDALAQKDKSSFGTERRTSKSSVSKPDGPAISKEEIEAKDKSTFGKDRPSLKAKAKAKSRTGKRGAKSTAADDDEEDEDRTTKRENGLALLDCVTRGLSSKWGLDKFTLGGQADSVYEYLPKEYALLGGVNEQYRHMYSAFMDATKKYLLYRPMIKDTDRHLLFTGSYSTSTTNRKNAKGGHIKGEFDSTTGHLTCFIGATVALGAKLFDRGEEEMKIAERLTDGCIWAYEQTATGVMAEDLDPVPCESAWDKPCEWDEAKWWEGIDASAEQAINSNIKQIEKAKVKENAEEEESTLPTKISKGDQNVDLEKRQLDVDEEEDEHKTTHQTTITKYGMRSPTESARSLPTTLKSYMEERISEGHLTPGVGRYRGRGYILRPEAIESVFYLYRITGKDYYRQKGWDMFQAITKATEAEYGNAAIQDVTSKNPELRDSAESFWTGETLKYFYLLFDDEDKVSLDDWIFSTEAHPLRRADAKVEKDVKAAAGGGKKSKSGSAKKTSASSSGSKSKASQVRDEEEDED